MTHAAAIRCCELMSFTHMCTYVLNQNLHQIDKGERLSGVFVGNPIIVYMRNLETGHVLKLGPEHFQGSMLPRRLLGFSFC